MFFFFNDTATTYIYTLSLHDALPISSPAMGNYVKAGTTVAELEYVKPCFAMELVEFRSEEHTSELQSHHDIVCLLLLEKKNAMAELTSELRLAQRKLEVKREKCANENRGGSHM